MIAYVYWSESKIINCKIDNITSVSDGEIMGDSTIIFNSSSQDYIILESDTINLNIGDKIDISNLTDARSYFIKGKDYWYQEQIKTANETITSQQETISSHENTISTLTTTGEELQCFALELQYQIDTISVSS